MDGIFIDSGGMRVTGAQAQGSRVQTCWFCRHFNPGNRSNENLKFVQDAVKEAGISITLWKTCIHSSATGVVWIKVSMNEKGG